MADEVVLSDRAVVVLTVSAGDAAATNEAPPLRETKTVFHCWRCDKVLRALPGEAPIVRDQVQCRGCGSLNALDYAYPLARVETV